MKRMYIVSMVLLISSISAAASTLNGLRALWLQQEYPTVIPRLLDYRDGLFGRNVEVDYMLATSLCRNPGDDDLGRSFLGHILAVYELSTTNRVVIANELNHCPERSAPTEIAFLTNRATGGGDVGVRGKSFYFIGGENRALGGDPLEATREIPDQEIQARLFTASQQTEARQAMQQRLGPDAKVMTTPHYVIGSLSGHSDREMTEIARLLDAAMDFFTRQYAIIQPDKLISIYLYPDGNLLRNVGANLHGLDIKRGTIGYSFRNDLSVSAIVKGPMTGTLKHELTHLLVRTNFGDVPAWLDEGLAALYEVSRMEGDYLRGLPNWRGQVLQRYWYKTNPTHDALIGMDWSTFDGNNQFLEQQAVNHALARYWVLFLQDKALLAPVYHAIKNQDLRAMRGSHADNQRYQIESATGMSMRDLQDAFFVWYDKINRALNNTDIATAQRALHLLGYDPGEIDGYYGTNSIRAVKAYQRDQGYDEDGQLDAVLFDEIKAKAWGNR
ncbi:peptidoglycan-binding domain-containing protein [Alteromonas sp. CYL-A6]|uniref:peptidoglycan-binding domain-containing protein n=1 Tax=Alteromonas nitratireducens TaxID=3390813 RepID=UPI0034C04661